MCAREVNEGVGSSPRELLEATAEPFSEIQSAVFSCCMIASMSYFVSFFTSTMPLSKVIFWMTTPFSVPLALRPSSVKYSTRTF